MSIIASFVVPHPPLIIPEVGKGNEKEVIKTINSYERVADEIRNLEPETIVISSPHTVCYRDYFYVSSGVFMNGSFAAFGAGEVSFSEKIDVDLAREIESISKNREFPAGFIDEEVELDHGTMVPLYYIRKKYPKSKILVVGLSGLSLKKHFEFGQIIDNAINNVGRKVVFIASGDLSHKLQEYGPYGFVSDGPIYEERIIKTLSSANFRELLNYDKDFLDVVAECGHPSFTIMAGAWNNKSVKPTFLSHEDVTGVGYGLWTFYPKGDEYIELARKSINSYIRYHRKLDVPKDLSSKLLSKRSGVFVSIHKNGDLRGCIGTFLPVYRNVAEEIIENAISASTKDPRFFPIKVDELDELEINVDVLTEPEDIDSTEQLDPKKYGVIVSNGFRRGLLLPDLEGIDTVEEQITIAKEKAGISEDEDVLLQRFKVERHRE